LSLLYVYRLNKDRLYIFLDFVFKIYDLSLLFISLINTIITNKVFYTKYNEFKLGIIYALTSEETVLVEDFRNSH